MQNWKIKKMSVKRINVWLRAINFVLAHYQEDKKFQRCPFCDIAKRKPGETTSCDEKCLWGIIEGLDCMRFKNKLGYNFICVSIAREEQRWQTARIPMLRQWKKILKAELKRRAEKVA